MPEEDGSSAGELTISAWGRIMDPSQLEVMAEEFMDLNPGVTIRIEYAENNLGAVTNVEQSRDSYCSRVRAELLSGEADYILYSPPGSLNLYDISRSGVLLDLWPYWQQDETIDPNDYFENVLKAVEVDGKLTSMPFSFYFDCMYLNRAALQSIDVDPESITSLDSGLLLEWYEKARAVDPEIKLFFGEQGKDFLFGDEKFAYIDMDARTSSFDAPEFVQFLERTAQIDDAEPDLDRTANLYAQTAYLVNELLRCRATGEEPGAAAGGENDFSRQYVLNGRVGLACVANMNMSALTDVGLNMEYLAGPYPVTDTLGRLAVSSIDDFAIPSSMKNPDLAWKFISYCLRERESTILQNDRVFAMPYSANAPLNKKNFALLAEESGEVSNGPFESLVGKNGREIDGQSVLAAMEGFLSGELINRKLYSVEVGEILDEYYVNGLTTPEQCAEKIQGRTYIWLNE